MAKPGRPATGRILEIFDQLYPETKTQLNFRTPFQLLVATILSAQTTDRQVNAITGKLFEQYGAPADFARLEPAQLEEDIKSCGLYKNKARNIIQASRALVEHYSSEVPPDMDELVKLPGVGRKTANVVLANAFGEDVMAVDTHVLRVANRLGLARADTPDKTEADLMRSIPPGIRLKAHHWLIYHGRSTCRARNPRCEECQLNEYCRYYKSAQK